MTDFQVGPWTVEAVLNRVRSNAHVVQLEPKIMQVLLRLAERPGEVVKKEDLIRSVWADTFVTDDVLTRSISELRKVFADDPHRPAFIETIPRTGYRLIAPVSAEAAVAPLRSSEPPLEVRGHQSRRSASIVVACAVTITVAAMVWQLSRQAPLRADHTTISVLPFTNLSGDPAQEYFSDGITEEIITELSQISPERLGVVARTSAMHYRHTEKSVRDIGRELGADYILEGSVRRSGERVRVTTQLIRTADQCTFGPPATIAN